MLFKCIENNTTPIYTSIANSNYLGFIELYCQFQSQKIELENQTYIFVVQTIVINFGAAMIENCSNVKHGGLQSVRSLIILI